MAEEYLSVVRVSHIISCLRELRRQKIHRTFAGYLCIRRTAAREGRFENLLVNFRNFFDEFLSVPGGSENKPYIHAFTEEESSVHNVWYNRNVAGSYAQSSVRADSPFRKVVKIEGSKNNIRYSLLDRHWELAREHLTFGNKVPVVPLAVFLYRNYALHTYPPSVSDWVHIFQYEFGYLNENEAATLEFQHLFSDDSEHETFEQWFNTINESASSSN